MDNQLRQYLEEAGAMHSEYGVVPLTISIIQHGFQDPLLKKYLGDWYLPVSIIRYDGVNGDKLDWFIGSEFFRGIQEHVLHQIQKDPQLVQEILSSSQHYGDEVHRLAKENYEIAARQTRTYREIAERLRQLVTQMEKLCAYGFIAVMSDLYYLGFSKLLEGIIQTRANARGVETRTKEYVSILITPIKPTQGWQYKRALYECAAVGGAECIEKIMQDFFAIHYGHRGPVLSRIEVQNEIQEILDRRDGEQTYQTILREHADLEQQQYDIIHQLQLTEHEQYLFTTARQFIHIKAYRLEYLFEGYAAIDALLSQLEPQIGRSLIELKYMTFFELFAFLEQGAPLPDANTVQARRTFMTYTAISTDQVELRVGEEAETYLAQFLAKEKAIGERFSVHGSVACPGKVTGLAKIVNTKDDIHKVALGDILIAVQTSPEVLPAMKKAAAFVTDIGGITSHAAIVSREMKKPCIIGTKFATQVFKDGDIVEVDALNGYVKKISS